jgi:hypothetical protein
MTGDMVIVTDVAAGREEELRAHLRGLDANTGPLSGVRLPTHFARFVVVPLDGFKLFFSSRFDGEPGEYLAELCDQPAARAIWAFCDPDGAASAEALRAYLEQHRTTAPYIISVWPKQTVAQVNAAVARRARLTRFAIRAGGLDPIGLAHAFREEFCR